MSFSMRPGGPSRHEMNDNEAMRGYGAMMPGGQGLTNRNDAGLASKVDAENQAMAQQNYILQNQRRDMELAMPGQQIKAQDAMREMALADSDEKTKIQTGLNSLMANIIENATPSGGKYLSELHATTSDAVAGPEFLARLRKGQAMGVPKQA